MNPLKVKATGSPITSANISGLQTMTDAEVKNYIANVITEKFASVTDGTGTAELNITTNNSGAGTSIGTFVDTTRTESIGTHPATGAVTTTTYTAKQVTAAAVESITNRPLAWDSRLEEMVDADIDSTMDLCISAMVAESTYTAGQYKLQASAPSGGTWVSRYTLTDTAQGGNTVTYLWQKTVASSAPTVDLTPLKLFAGSNCKQMTEAEIEQMLPVFRNRIIETGIGTYKIQSDAPSGGTWIQTGNTFTDTREEVTPQNYAGNYSGNFTGNYSGTYGGAANYSGSRIYSGTYASNFSGNYAGSFTGPAYSSPYTGITYSTSSNYTGFFSSPVAYTGFYSGPSQSYTGFFSSPVAYTGFYTGAGSSAPAGPSYSTPAGSNPAGPSYSTPAGSNPAGPSYSTPAGSNPAGPAYSTNYAGNYGGNFDGPPPSREQIVYYTSGGPFAGTYTGFYSGPGGTFEGYYEGPPLAPQEPGDVYIGYYSGITNYAGFYASGIGYTGNFQGPSLYFVTGYDKAYYTGYYTGPPSYSTPAGSNPAGPSYSTPAGSNPAGPSYSTPAGSNPAGPAYSAPAVFFAGTAYTGYYTGPGPAYSGVFSGPGIAYTGFYTGPGPAYSGVFSGPTGTPYSATFTGTAYSGTYTGNFTGNYTGFFSGSRTYSGNYLGGGSFTGNYSGSYINNFTGTYSGATIQATKETVSSVKLWIRTA